MAIRNRLLGVGSALVLAASLGLAGCGKSAPRAEAAAMADPSAVAAAVNGEPIYVSDVELEARVQNLIENGERLEVDSAEFNEILDQLIDIKLLASEAISRGLDEEPESRHRLATARDNILGNILVDRVVEERVDDAAIKKMYETQIAIWELGDEAHVRHILAPTKEEVEKIATELKGGADFAVVASRRSADESTRMEGGDLGYMTAEEATPEFAKVIRETQTGGISKPFQSDMGWHIAKIDDRRKEQPPSIEELRGPILKHLTMMQIGEVLKELRKESKIVKQTSPRNSPLTVDPFETPATPKPPPSFDAAAPRPPVSDVRQPETTATTTPKTTTTAAKPTPAPAATTAKPPAATPPASSTSTPSAPVTQPVRPATTPPAAPPPAAPTPAPTGPVSEDRPGDGQ